MDDTIELIRALAELLQALQWPLLALVIALMFGDDIKDLLHRARSWKLFGLEGEFSDLVEELADSTSTSAGAGPGLEGMSPSTQGQAAADKHDEASEIFRLAAISPRSALMQLSAEIEETLIEKAQRLMGTDQQFRDLDVSHINMNDATRLLVSLGLMPVSLAENLARFRVIRNRVVHGGEGSEAEMLSAIDSGLTILRQLNAIEVPTRSRPTAPRRPSSATIRPVIPSASRTQRTLAENRPEHENAREE